MLTQSEFIKLFGKDSNTILILIQKKSVLTPNFLPPESQQKKKRKKTPSH